MSQSCQKTFTIAPEAGGCSSILDGLVWGAPVFTGGAMTGVFTGSGKTGSFGGSGTESFNPGFMVIGIPITNTTAADFNVLASIQRNGHSAGRFNTNQFNFHEDGFLVQFGHNYIGPPDDPLAGPVNFVEVASCTYLIEAGVTHVIEFEVALGASLPAQGSTPATTSSGTVTLSCA